MRTVAALAFLSLLPGLCPAAEKLTEEDRVELVRGLMAEYATVKLLLPRSKKPLEFNTDGTWDKKRWEETARVSGPAARNGDLVQITKVGIEGDRIVLEINHGMSGGRHWYQNVQISGPISSTQAPQGDSNAVSGTSLALLFHKPLEPIKSAEIKKMLAPVIDF